MPRSPHPRPAEVKLVSKPPGASVNVDGLRLPGQTPMTVELTTGHTGSLVRLSKKGFADGVWRADLSPGRHVVVGGKLRPAHWTWPW